MQRVRTYAHTQRRWSPAASGGGSRLAPVTRWRVAALCPAGPALLRLRRIAPPLETRGFALGRRACRRASWGFRLRVGLGLALLAVANPSWVWVWRSAGVLIPWQCCHRNRTPAARKNRVKRSVCRLSRCPLRALADTSTADTLREKSPSNAPCAACRGARCVPSRTPRQPTHSAKKARQTLRVPPAEVPASYPRGHLDSRHTPLKRETRGLPRPRTPACSRRCVRVGPRATLAVAVLAPCAVLRFTRQRCPAG